MPRTSERYSIKNKLLDKRYKLTDDDKKMIRASYKGGDVSLQNLADAFNVSKKTILLTVNDKSYKKSIEYSKMYCKLHKPPKERRNKYIKRYREHKEKLFKEGLIGDKDV